MAVWSEVLFDDLTRDRRLDAEYYKPVYLEQERRVKLLASKPLNSLAAVSDGNHLTISNQFSDEGVRYLRGQDLNDFFVSDSNAVYIPEEAYDKLKRSHMFPGDVLLSIVGTIGNVALVTEQYTKLTGSCKIAIIRPHSISPYFLAIYFASKIGQDQIARRVRGAVQQGVILPDLKEFPIPVVSDDQENEIERLVIATQQKRNEAKSLYAQAEALLLHELGLDTLDLSHQTTFTATFAEVMEARRLDAEYFQPKYTHLIAAIQNTGQAVRLGNWVSETIRRGILPDYVEDGDITVINSQHVGKTHVELDDNRTTSRAFTQVSKNMRAVVKKYDVLLNSTGYITIGRAQTLLDDVEAVVDGHVSIIRPKQGLDPVYLGLYLNSLPGQLQTERGWTGSSGQIELRPEVVSEYVIWKAPEPVQQQIRQLVETSHQARKEASQLLEQAKQQVEELILEGN